MLLGIAAGSTNFGIIGPTAFYANTAVVLTANGGEISGSFGSISIAVEDSSVSSGPYHAFQGYIDAGSLVSGTIIVDGLSRAQL